MKHITKGRDPKRTFSSGMSEGSARKLVSALSGVAAECFPELLVVILPFGSEHGERLFQRVQHIKLIITHESFLSRQPVSHKISLSDANPDPPASHSTHSSLWTSVQEKAILS
jgi:hypothetical protein